MQIIIYDYKDQGVLFKSLFQFPNVCKFATNNYSSNYTYISHRGATCAPFLVSFLLVLWKAMVISFVRKTHTDGHRLWQDNDPKHSNNSNKERFKHAR